MEEIECICYILFVASYIISRLFWYQRGNQETRNRKIKDRHCNGQKDKGHRDKQWSSQNYTEIKK
jgi:hypothetical protein